MRIKTIHELHAHLCQALYGECCIGDPMSINLGVVYRIGEVNRVCERTKIPNIA